MTESLGDNDPVSVNLPYTIQIQDPNNSLESEDGKNDIFVCRKCNKIFNNLSEYVEHKVKEENFSLGRTRAKSDQRIILPHLFEKRKKKPSTEAKDKRLKTAHGTQEKSKDGVEDQNNVEQDGGSCLGEKMENDMYMCKHCDKTFKREAALRWHLKWDHTSKDSGDDWSTSDEENDSLVEKDEDLPFEPKKRDLPSKETSEPKTQEIVVKIEKSASVDDSLSKESSKEIPNMPSSLNLKPSKKKNEQKKPAHTVIKEERPYSCHVCGRSFKEITVLKAHALVHSDQRHFICEVENCPYAFKTKGGLVRHMRRHTGDRPYNCDKCGRAFAESGALTRHLKGRRNCAELSDKAYPRYKKSWNYHPNIPAVADPAQRDPQCGRSTLGSIHLSSEVDGGEEIQFIITELLDDDPSDITNPEVVNDSSEAISAIPSSTTPGSYTVTISSLEDPLSTTDELPKENGDLKTADPDKAVMTENAEDADVMEEPKETETQTSKKVNDLAQEKPATNLLPSAIARTNENKKSSTAEEGSNLAIPSKAESSLPASIPIIPSTGPVQSDTLVPTTSKHGPEGQIRPGVELDDDEFVNVQMGSQPDTSHPTCCLVCKKNFEAIEGLEIHLQTHLADGPSRCGLCHFTAQDREELRHHILGMHYQSLNDIEASVLAMEVEEASLKKGETVQSRQLKTRSALTAVKQLYSLKKLKNSSQQEKPGLSATGSVQCMVCNKFFRGNSYLRQHMRTHTGDRPHQCLKCGRSFISRDILKKHMYVHVERKDYKCGECGKLFKRLGHVQQHLRSHSQERTFRCSVCDKLFKTQHSLKVHLRTHSGINPYKCQICNNQFRERGSLQRHMRLHTGEKPFKCHLCNRAFAEQGTLSRHLKSKVPCSANRDGVNSNPQASMLAQFSTVVASSEQIFVPLDQGAQKIIVPADQSGQQIILGGDSSAEATEHGLGQQHFFVAAGPEDQELQVGSEYVVLQSGEEVSVGDTSGDTVSVAANEAIVDFNANFEPEQIPGTETLQVVDSTTGESVIIVAEKAIVDLVREKYCMLQSTEAGCSLAMIEQVLLEAKEDLAKSGLGLQEQVPPEDAVIVKEEYTEETVEPQVQLKEQPSQQEET